MGRKSFYVVVGLLVAVAAAIPAHAMVLTDPSSVCTGASVLEAVDYYVSPDRGGATTRYVATLRNDGLCTYEYGNPFSIAVRDGGRWRGLPFGEHCAFTLEAHSLPPGGSASKRVGWLSDSCRYRPLPPGRYRVSETIRSQQNPGVPSRSRTLHAYFRVKG